MSAELLEIPTDLDVVGGAVGGPSHSPASEFPATAVDPFDAADNGAVEGVEGYFDPDTLADGVSAESVVADLVAASEAVAAEIEAAGGTATAVDSATVTEPESPAYDPAQDPDARHALAEKLHENCAALVASYSSPPPLFDPWQSLVVAAESRVAFAESAWESAKEESKACKEAFDTAVAELRSIVRQKQSASRPLPLLDALGGTVAGITFSAPGHEPVSIGQGVGQPVESSPHSTSPDSWRRVPTSALNLGSIKGMGEKKVDEILSHCPTIGDLEDLRAKGSGKGLGLRSIKGVGEEKAQAIEDRILEWLTKNRDAAVLSSASLAAPLTESATAVDPAPTPIDPQTPPADNPLPADSGSPATPPLPATFPINNAERTILEISARLTAAPDSDLDPVTDPKVWESGFEGQGKGWLVTECPYAHGQPEQEDWIRGFVSAERAGQPDGLAEDEGDSE